MSEHGRGKRIKEGIDIIVEEARAAAAEAYEASGAESLGENVREAIQRALESRQNVLMVRLNEESIRKIDELVDAGIVSSRSEAAAFLVQEGIKTRKPLFDQIAETTEQIRKAKEDLRQRLHDNMMGGPEEKKT